MVKLMTKAELEAHDGLSPEDKDLVEKQVTEYGGGYKESPDLPVRQAIRGYLVKELDEMVVDDNLRGELSGDAACFADGWQAAMEYQEQGSV